MAPASMSFRTFLKQERQQRGRGAQRRPAECAEDRERTSQSTLSPCAPRCRPAVPPRQTDVPISCPRQQHRGGVQRTLAERLVLRSPASPRPTLRAKCCSVHKTRTATATGKTRSAAEVRRVRGGLRRTIRNGHSPAPAVFPSLLLCVKCRQSFIERRDEHLGIRSL